MKSMERYVDQFSTLVTVEQHLLNAVGEIHFAKLRLTGESPLRAELQRLHQAIEDATNHARESKRALLAEWRAAETGVFAA